MSQDFLDNLLECILIRLPFSSYLPFIWSVSAISAERDASPIVVC